LHYNYYVLTDDNRVVRKLRETSATEITQKETKTP